VFDGGFEQEICFSKAVPFLRGGHVPITNARISPKFSLAEYKKSALCGL
jgi:hypothetical protein